MAWLSRFFGDGRKADSNKRGTAEACLSGAGWLPGRTCDITALEELLRKAGFRLNDAGRQFLSEYYGLTIDVPITGHEDIKGFVHFAPEMVLRFLRPDALPRLAALMPASVCPVGTTSGHTVSVFMDDRGRSYLLDMEWSLFAPLANTPADMVLALCDGQNGRVDSQILDDHGRPTGEIIRVGNEKRHWQLDQFPNLTPFLPPVSLSPALRPPTWRAMVRAAEQTLSRGGRPDGLLVTCGGFTAGPSGQQYYVAHCENCLYVRSRAGFRVSAPPPGISPGFRVGEVIAFQPPPGW
jgi:hypothetical protein